MHKLEKYDWQKPHQSNLTGTEKAYYPNKDKDGIKKKYSSWKQ
ncbi:NADH-ubiquinone oxidoreductase subunit NDUFA12 family protein [Candidatus Pelagibacter bacterium]|nr:NADH-ubiquinone oxidoreductase subunit NDUFA12 family protein [Candidatus Pelagibacter bacterium]